MAGRDPVEVTAQVDGREVAAGTLWIHDRSGQSATFRYADSYLAERGSYDLDRALPKAAGVFHTPPGSDNPALLSTAIDFDDTTASIDVALAVCGHFRLSRSAARRLMGDVERATSRWRDVARQLGLPAVEIERMTTAYETDQRRVARAMTPA